MRAGAKKFNLDIDTEDAVGKDVSPRANAGLRKSPFARKSPLNARKSPLNSRKFGAANPYGKPQLTGVSAMSGISSAYASRRMSAIELKTKSPRDMWRAPETFEEDEEDDVELVTLVKEEHDIMVFETDAPEVDFDQLNDQEAQDMQAAAEQQADTVFDETSGTAAPQEVSKVVQGRDIITKEISTEAAYQFFRQLEESSGQKKMSVEIESGGFKKPSLKALEVPSAKIARLEKELAELQDELIDLEQEEIPTKLPKDEQSAKEQLKQIEELRDNMHKMIGSAQFQDLEQRTLIHFKDVFKPNQPALGDSGPGAKKEEEKEFVYENTQDLKGAMNTMLAENLSKLNPRLAASVELTDEIGLFVKNNIDAEDARHDTLKVEQLTKYLKLQEELDSCEKLVGQWNPLNKFSNIYTVMDQLQDQIEEFNTRSDDQNGAAPANRYGGPTPTHQSRQVDSISKRAQTFNSELEKLQMKLGSMKDVHYERAKIDFVFRMTERALESNSHLDAILERLKVLENMHRESPNIQTQIKDIKEHALIKIPEAMRREERLIEKVQDQLVKAVKELQEQL